MVGHAFSLSRPQSAKLANLSSLCCWGCVVGMGGVRGAVKAKRGPEAATRGGSCCIPHDRLHPQGKMLLLYLRRPHAQSQTGRADWT
jgi:hypothetical protein